MAQVENSKSPVYEVIRVLSVLLIRAISALRCILQSAAGKKSDDFSRVDYSYYLREALGFGIEARVLRNDVLRLRKGDKVRHVWHSFTDFDGEGTLMVAGDKALCSELMKEAGIPVPEHVVIKRGDYRSALMFRRRIGGHIVVKPARDTGDGRGVFIKPASFFSIWWAVNGAGVYGKEVIVEKFYEGSNFRLLYCNNEFLSACARIPAYVQGNGHNSVRELIEMTNVNRIEQGRYIEYHRNTRPILYKVRISRSTIKVLKRQGYHLESIPKRGVKVFLQDICHWLQGGIYVEVTPLISPYFIELGKRAVEAVGAKMAGVDLIARDVREATPGSFVVNEVNTSPGLLVHYEVQNQENMRPVARDILRLMFDL